jgi:hypothetical protein
MHHDPGDLPVFPPEVTTHLVKLACELPEEHDRSLSLWTCAELARALVLQGLVESISAQTVQRLLWTQRLRPWRVHHWLHYQGPRDQAFADKVTALCQLYTQPLTEHERVLCLDEKTSIQPRPRKAATRPARPGAPVRLEAEYKRCGALNLFSALDTRTGQVTSICRRRKRQLEFLELLELIDCQSPATVRRITLVCDNVSVHHGKLVCAWLAKHPRFQLFFLPVHCSWMNQVEQFFSIVQRKRLVASRFESLEHLERQLLLFMEQWNQTAKPFAWTKGSFDKVLSKVERSLRAAQLPLAA